jgi:trehalose 2-sulfotransferase
MKPKLCYTIWFSQRTGSTLLCKALASTGIAGNPGEWLNINNPERLRDHYGAGSFADLQETLWTLGSTPNGVFGLKFGLYEPHFSTLLDELRKFPDAPKGVQTRVEVWEHAFPNSHHIFMTRRNKVRLAVSWWKAIKSDEWHRESGKAPSSVDLADAYSFDAINHLYAECAMREAGMQEFFSEACIVPLTVVYEDFIQAYEATVHQILDHLGLETSVVPMEPPYYAQLADEISERWVQRFREERQQGWVNRGW